MKEDIVQMLSLASSQIRAMKNYLSINKISVFVMLVFFAISAKTQVNLVQNPSFEYYSTCPNNVDQLWFAEHWIDLIDTSGGSPNFFHACANASSIINKLGTPINGLLNTLSYQQPHSGAGYAKISLLYIVMQNPNLSTRDYMLNELKTPLKANTNYCVTFYLSLIDYMPAATNVIGAYFDNGSLTANNQAATHVSPQMEYISPTMWADTQNWVKVQGSFTATGGETYMTLGNFRNNANSNYQQLISPGNGYWTAFYYIDDISVIESDLSAFAGNDTTLQNVGDSVYLGRPAEIGLECMWYNWAGDSIGTGAGIWITPSHTQPYIVEQNLCGTIKRDTVYVSVGTSVENGAAFEGLKVFPNPSEGSFVIQSQNFERFSTVVSIFDISGKVLYQETFPAQERIEIQTDFPAGVYLLQVQDSQTGGKVVRRLMIQ